MFALRVEYLLGRVYAASHMDRDALEWPPHPSRLFSALVAAAHEANLGAPARDALCWLERQPPPSLSFPDVYPRNVVTSFVPVNDRAGDHGTRGRQPRSFPSAGLPPDATAGWFVWDTAEPDDATRRELVRIAAEVGHLGHSASLVSVREDLEPGEPTWVSDAEGTLPLRVPTHGRLEALDIAFAVGRRPPDGRVALYRLARAQRDEIAIGPYGALHVLRIECEDEVRTFPLIRHVGQLSETVRAAWMKALGADVPSVVHGHGGPHVAIVPLPAIGHPRSNGRVHGIGVAVPARLGPVERSELDRALAVLPGLRVYTRPGITWRLVRAVEGDDLPRTLDATTWLRPSRTWASVTPVVLDRFPRRSLSEDQIVAASLVLSGYPTPTRLRVDRFSCVPGVPPAFAFASRRDGPQRPVLHVCVEFPCEVRGPMLVGQLRHYGLGLLKPVRADSATAWLDGESA